jgi:hypothetical protein
MIFRALDGSIVEVNRRDYKDDKEYYATIANVVLGKRFSSNQPTFISKTIDIINKRPYK